jgi:hypothetical protein
MRLVGGYHPSLDFSWDSGSGDSGDSDDSGDNDVTVVTVLVVTELEVTVPVEW